MKIFATPVNHSYNKENSPIVSFQQYEYSDYKIAKITTQIDDIFSKPIEKRSHHLIHEYNPIDKKPIEGKFKFVADDGAMVKVIRSVARNQIPPLAYIMICVEKNGQQDYIRLNPQNGRIIKSGIERSALLCQRIKYYQNKDINSSDEIQKVLSYIPEILKYTNSIPRPALEPAKIQKIVIKDNVSDSQTPTSKVAQAKPPAKKQPTISAGASYLAQTRNILATPKIDKSKEVYFIEETQKIDDIIDINNELKDYIGNLTNKARHKSLAENFEKLFFRFSGSHSLVLKDLKNERAARILYYPDGDMLRITYLDKEGKTTSGYLIKDGKKIVKNFNTSSPFAIPRTLKYFLNGDMPDRKKIIFNEDITEIWEKMQEAKAILDRIQNPEPAKEI